MRHLTRFAALTLVVISTAGLGACQKAQVGPEVCISYPREDTSELLVGRWELTQTSGGLAGRVLPADPTRKQEIVFTVAGKAEFLLNGVVTNTTSYSLTQATAYITQRPQLFLSYATSPAPQQFIEQISTSTLVLADDMTDGIGYTYARR